MNFFYLLFFPFLIISVLSCEISDLKSTPYSTTDGLVIAESAYIVTFTATCKDTLNKGLPNLFADTGNGVVPVIVSPDSNRYSISWTTPLAKSYSSNYAIKVYDEEGYTQLKRKAQINPLFVLQLSHPGTSKGPIVQTEFIAATFFAGLLYFAYSYKQSLYV